MTRMGADKGEEAGLRLAGQAGAVFSNPFTSELARDCENTSRNRSAIGPASALRADEDRRPEIGDRRWGSAELARRSTLDTFLFL